MPYEEFRKLLENQKPPSRWERITLRGAIKWTFACGLIVIARLIAR